MAKFPIGARVKLKANKRNYHHAAIRDRVGAVADINRYPWVDWDGFTEGHAGPHKDGRTSCLTIYEGWLELAEPREPAA